MGWKAMGDAHDHFLKRFYLYCYTGGPVHLPTVTVAVVTILLILMFRWINRRWGWGLPEFLLGLIGAALFTLMLGLVRS